MSLAERHDHLPEQFREARRATWRHTGSVNWPEIGEERWVGEAYHLQQGTKVYHSYADYHNGDC